MAFERRKLGRTELEVSPMGLGGGYGVGGDTVQWAFDHGINYFFWATWIPTYRTMGKKLKELVATHRDEIVVASAPYSWLMPGSIERSITDHLRRLKTDHIDVFLLGWVMRESQERAIEELVRIKEKGLARYIGFSGHDRPMILRLAQRWPVFDVLMIRYNGAHRGAEKEVFDHLGEKRPGVIAFNALKQGRMLKAPRGWPSSRPVPTARQSYRFALSHPSVDICLSGARTLDQVQDLPRVIEDGPLSEEELSFIRDFGDLLHG